MKIALLTNVISPHQLPLARELVKKTGRDSYRYIYTETLEAERTQLGWNNTSDETWCVQGTPEDPVLQDADLLFSELRELDLFERRITAGKLTFYVSERWFKPPVGFLRILFPAYFRMAKRFLKAFQSPYFFYYPQGVHAARDMARLILLMQGNLKYLFTSPKIVFGAYPGGPIISFKEAAASGILSQEEIEAGKKDGFVSIASEKCGKIHPEGFWKKIKIWGYFVETSKSPTDSYDQENG